jgi:type I restriction enzyme S subunit
LDDKIEQNRRTSAALERLARAIFRAWFVDFEPVKAKAAGAHSFPSMPQEVFDALPTRLVDSELAPVPEGWGVMRWGSLATLEYGKSLRGYQDARTGFRVYGTNGSIGYHSKPLADGPGIVIGRKGAYRGVHYSPDAFWAIDTAFFLKPKRYFDLKWAYYEILRVDINSMDSGSAIPSTSRDDFYAILTCLPNEKSLRAFDFTIGPMFRWREAVDAENAKLAQLRDYLLPKLLSGEVRVREAERAAAAAG